MLEAVFDITVEHPRQKFPYVLKTRLQRFNSTLKSKEEQLQHSIFCCDVDEQSIHCCATQISNEKNQAKDLYWVSFLQNEM